AVVRWGLRGINQADNGTRIYPEDRDHRKVVTGWITYWYIVTSHDQPQSPRAVRRHRRAPAAIPRAGSTRQPHPREHQVRHVHLDLRRLDRRRVPSGLPRRTARQTARGVRALSAV